MLPLMVIYSQYQNQKNDIGTLLDHRAYSLFTFFFLIDLLFIWLHWVLVVWCSVLRNFTVTCRLLVVACGI